MMKRDLGTGYDLRTHPAARLYPQPHGYLQGSKVARLALSNEDISARPTIRLFSGRLSPTEYQRRRTFRS